MRLSQRGIKLLSVYKRNNGICGRGSRMNEELVAPCGMNCGTCSGYLAYSKGIPKKRGAIIHCAGCRPRDKRCAYLKGNCHRLSKGMVRFCHECGEFPCLRLRHLDKRYVKNFNVSLIANLQRISTEGVKAFLQEEKQRYQCSRCGGTICIHNGKCYDCDPIESWRAR